MKPEKEDRNSTVRDGKVKDDEVKAGWIDSLRKSLREKRKSGLFPEEIKVTR